MAVIELKVDGMTCDGCVRGVSRKLLGLAGVSTARVDLGAGKAIVEYDESRATPAGIVAAVEQIGYKAVAI